LRIADSLIQPDLGLNPGGCSLVRDKFQRLAKYLNGIAIGKPLLRILGGCHQPTGRPVVIAGRFKVQRKLRLSEQPGLF